MEVVVTETADPGPGLLSWGVTARLLWMAIRLILILCLGERGVLFFYQGF